MEVRKMKYDVIIVGAGPAGSNFARLLDTKKYKALIIDGSTDHDKVCGGLLSPDAQDILARYDLCLPKEILASPQLFSVRTIDLSNNLVRHYRRSYMNVDRKGLDSFFKDLIPRAVDKISGRCKRVAKTDSGYEIELVSGEKLSCKWVVGADGASGNVRMSLFKEKELQKYVAIQQWFPAGETNPYYSCIFDRETSDSCSWTIHKDGYVIFGGAFEPSGCREAFERQKRRFEAFVGERFGEVCKSEACLVTSPRKSRDFSCGKERVYLLGEAAGFISASSFEGISCAILSGRILAKAFCEGKNHTQIVQIYRRKTTSLRLKLLLKTFKRWVLCTPLTRHAIMKSGIRSMKKQLTDE
jgi:flavin-dependent dehydrogenase